MNSIPLDKILKAKRLRLRIVSFSDIDLVWSASRYEGFNDGMTWEPPADRKELIHITENNLQDWKNDLSDTFTVELTNPLTPIGRIDIRREDEPDVWSIGFWVHPEHQNRGNVTEAAQRIMEFGFTELNASKITTAHAVWNKSSRLVIETLGFSFVREEPCGFMKDGKPVAEFEYEITKE
jgi:[ribosomal protein S5]-alanine N-acetyltransferase